MPYAVLLLLKCHLPVQLPGKSSATATAEVSGREVGQDSAHPDIHTPVALAARRAGTVAKMSRALKSMANACPVLHCGVHPVSVAPGERRTLLENQIFIIGVLMQEFLCSKPQAVAW